MQPFRLSKYFKYIEIAPNNLALYQIPKSSNRVISTNSRAACKISRKPQNVQIQYGEPDWNYKTHRGLPQGIGYQIS